MAEETAPGTSTPSATASVAQTREKPSSAPQAPTVAPAGHGIVDRDFTIDERVARAAQRQAYERQAGDPLYRPLRIFSLDPSASRLEGAEATVNVPYEPLAPGPIGRLFEVDDFDSTQRTHWGRADLDQHAALLNDGRSPSTSDPLFHQQMVYAVCSTVYATFRRALGRHPTWGFSAPPAFTSSIGNFNSNRRFLRCSLTSPSG